MSIPVDTFPALESLGLVRQAFLCRAPEIDVVAAREIALDRLREAHEIALCDLGFATEQLITTRQVHGAEIAVVDAVTPAPAAGADGLITNDPRVCLGIYVADCCAVYLVDPPRRAIGLVHAGRKGTELGIARRAIEQMTESFGCEPSRLVVQLGPCIRPPAYEVDFAGAIVQQCREAGVTEVHDCGRCTASDPERYYSYRREKGRTGRMLALLALEKA